MERDEFKTWFRHHRARFPNIAAWLTKDRVKWRAQAAGEVSQEDILAGWYDCLTETSLADAIAASDVMNSGPIDPDLQCQDHARLVRKLAREIKDNRDKAIRQQAEQIKVGSDYRHECEMCGDSGVVFVWHPNAMRAARDGCKDIPLYSAAAACICRRGDGNLQSCAGTRFDGRKMLLYPDAHVWEKVPELIAFMGTRVNPRIFNPDNWGTVPEPEPEEAEELEFT